MYICNAFSLNMLTSPAAEIFTRPLSIEDVQDFNAHNPLVSVVGHADTAAVFSTVLGFPVSENRISLKLASDDALIVGQYTGPRLPAGATELPEGATIEWMLVGVRYVNLK